MPIGNLRTEVIPKHDGVQYVFTLDPPETTIILMSTELFRNSTLLQPMPSTNDKYSFGPYLLTLVGYNIERRALEFAISKDPFYD